jgi:flagellar motor switch protein FliG
MSTAVEPSSFSKPQKAAILIMYLDREVSKKILAQLSDDEVRTIGMAMASIDKVTPLEIESVVAEFLRELVDTTLVNYNGPGYVKEILPGLIDEERRDQIIPPIQRRVDREFEIFIKDRKPGAVAALLKDEQTQVQAVALALMGSDNAARVLRYMDQHRQADVTMRMSRLKHIPGDIADDIMGAIRRALGAAEDYIEVGGVDKTARILGKMRRKDQQPILGAVEDEDGDLAESLRRRMVVFQDLLQLNRRAMQTLLKNVDKDDLRKGLKDARPETIDFFLSNVSKRQAEELREEIEISGPVQKSRVRLAQENIVAEALKLMEEGVIFLDLGAPDDEEE